MLFTKTKTLYLELDFYNQDNINDLRAIFEENDYYYFADLYPNALKDSWDAVLKIDTERYDDLSLSEQEQFWNIINGCSEQKVINNDL